MMMFMDLLEALRPAERFMPMVKAVLLDVWEERTRQQQQIAAAIRQRIAELQTQTQRVRNPDRRSTNQRAG
jgi:hypothetical protein